MNNGMMRVIIAMQLTKLLPNSREVRMKVYKAVYNLFIVMLITTLTGCASSSIREYAQELEDLSTEYRTGEISAQKLNEEVNDIAKAMKIRAFLEGDRE